MPNVMQTAMAGTLEAALLLKPCTVWADWTAHRASGRPQSKCRQMLSLPRIMHALQMCN